MKCLILLVMTFPALADWYDYDKGEQVGLPPAGATVEWRAKQGCQFRLLENLTYSDKPYATPHIVRPVEYEHSTLKESRENTRFIEFRPLDWDKALSCGEHAKSFLDIAREAMTADWGVIQPDWSSTYQKKYVIKRKRDQLIAGAHTVEHEVIAFRTKAARNAFLEAHQGELFQFFEIPPGAVTRVVMEE